MILVFIPNLIMQTKNAKENWHELLKIIKTKQNKKNKLQNYDNNFQNISEERIEEKTNLMFKYYNLKYDWK